MFQTAAEMRTEELTALYSLQSENKLTPKLTLLLLLPIMATHTRHELHEKILASFIHCCNNTYHAACINQLIFSLVIKVSYQRGLCPNLHEEILHSQ